MSSMLVVPMPLEMKSRSAASISAGARLGRLGAAARNGLAIDHRWESWESWESLRDRGKSWGS
jgi:hypothetical protein